ncbi:MAG: iron-containing alcohol dehydrogenase [Planctomycetes bacterium]|nr:iron-containing alcohol dehydrogenase [Planctomycetota bacterium]
MEHIDPTDIVNINERVRAWAGSGERLQPVRIDRIVLADDSIDALTDELRGMAAGKRVLVVVDQTPMRRGGDDLKPLLEEAMARVCEPDVRTPADDAHGHFHADFESAQRFAGELGGQPGNYAAIVSIGSGSITDVAKYARHLHAEKTGASVPFVCFPTAASVTAYTSALAVLTIAGVKRTLPALPPDIVICDLRTLAGAPRRMTQAGFGDVLARSVSYGDWYLANQLGMDDGFSLVPGRLLKHAEQEMLGAATGVAGGKRAAVHAVMNALLLAGMAMSVVRQTAPLSGWEHAISHFFDLTAAGDGRKTALHGAQVGVATLVSARAYELAWHELDVEQLTSDRDETVYRKTLERVFGRYDTTGALLAELWEDLAKKLARWREASAVRQHFIVSKRAGEYDDFIEEAVRSARAVENALREAGAPRRFCDLDEPIGGDSVTSAVRFAHLVRARFTFGDLLSECNWLDGGADAILKELA